jgi:siroheme synthase-like protein
MENTLPPAGSEKNNLFPVFLKLEQLSVLIIGGGNIAYEKLQALLANSPQTQIRLVAKSISKEIHELVTRYSNISLQQKPYEESDLDAADLVIVAVNDLPVCEIIKQDASARKILVNVADTPSLCDFYLGSVVSKGHLKIAISTNGKSPTIAKRLKEVFNEMIPDEMDGVLNNMHHIRENIQGGFSEKVKQLDTITQMLVTKKDSQ